MPSPARRRRRPPSAFHAALSLSLHRPASSTTQRPTPVVRIAASPPPSLHHSNRTRAATLSLLPAVPPTPTTERPARISLTLYPPLGLSLAESPAPHRAIIVTAVRPGSPAAGVVRAGDVVAAVSGAAVRSLAQLQAAIRTADQRPVSLVVERCPLPAPPPTRAPVPDSPAVAAAEAAAASVTLPVQHDVATAASSPPPPLFQSPTPSSTSERQYAEQDAQLADSITNYGALCKRHPSDPSAEAAALTAVHDLAERLARSRVVHSVRSAQFILSILYRLKRATVPLSAKLYNVLMTCLTRCGAPDRAVALFAEINNPTLECFTSLAKAYSMLSRPDDAIALLPVMRANGVRPNVRTYNALIASCVRGGMLAKARQLFTEMLADEVRPNVVSWNIIIHWHAKQNSRVKRLSGTLGAFEDMKASGVQPNVVTFTTLMKAYAKSGLLEKAEEIFAEMKHSIPNQLDSTVYDTLLVAYSRRLEWRRCIELLDEMNDATNSDDTGVAKAQPAFERHDVVPAHSRSFSGRRPWLLRDSQDDEEGDWQGMTTSSSTSATAVSYSIVVKACATAGRTDMAREIFDEMLESGFVPPPDAAVVSLLSGYAQVGQLSESFAVLKNLKDWGVFPEVRMLSSLMHACLVANQPKLALSIYAKFKVTKFEPDVVITTLLLRAYGSLGELDKMFNVLKGMRGQKGETESRTRPTVVTYNIIIENCLKHGRTDLAIKALELLSQDRENGVRMDRNTYAALVQGLTYRDGDVLNVPVEGAPVAALSQSLAASERRKTSSVRRVASWAQSDVDSTWGKSAGTHSGSRASTASESRPGSSRQSPSMRLSDEDRLQFLVTVLEKVREAQEMPNGDLYVALLKLSRACGDWELGCQLVAEREAKRFSINKRDSRAARSLEDMFQARMHDGDGDMPGWMGTSVL